MSAPSCAFGSEPASQLRPASPFIGKAAEQLSTVKDLLAALDESAAEKTNNAMLWATARHLSAFANVPLSELPIEALFDVGQSFSLYLKERRYATNTVRTYVHNANRLLKRAEELGWLSGTKAIAEAWQPILAAVKGIPGAPAGVVRFAIRNKKHPGDFCEADLQEWGQWMERCGRKHRTVRMLKNRFRRGVLRAGLNTLLPKFNCRPHPSEYKVRTCDMPDPLRSELAQLLTWKQARYARGRPQRGRLRPVSARQLEQWINRLFGYAKNIAGYQGITTLLDLVSEDVVSSFVDWALNERNVAGKSLMKLSMIHAVVRHHPTYKEHDWKWFPKLFNEFPVDDESARQERKAKKTVPYDVLAAVPKQIREFRLRKKSDGKSNAWLVQCELLMSWLTTLPWRQRNLRECRLGQPETANLFRAELPALTHVAKPKWVQDALIVNPHHCVWQFHFRDDETKTGLSVRGVLPRRLIPLLEDYLQNHRPNLVSGRDPGTLFLNHSGAPLDRQEMTEVVSQLALEHTGRRVTPHLCRDIFAYKFLEAHPEDYLNLSKVLWHQNIRTTLRIYGRNFDESNGARCVDEWLGA